MVKKLEQAQRSETLQLDEKVSLAIQHAIGRPKRDVAACHHIQPNHFKAGEPVSLELSIEKPVESVRLYFRHVNHAERYEIVEMQPVGKNYRATIPAEYTNSLYHLQYYFEPKEGLGKSWLYPGFNKDLTNQPYFVVLKG